MDSGHTQAQPGSFLRQVDEIRQGLEGEGEIGEELRVEAWQDEVSDLGEDSVPLTDQEEYSELEIKKLLNDPKGEEAAWEQFVRKVREVTGGDLDGKVAIVERLVWVFKGEKEQDTNQAVSLLLDMKLADLHDTRAYKRLGDMVQQFKEAEEKVRELMEHLAPEEPVDRSTLKLRTVLTKTSRRVEVEKVHQVLKSLERLHDYPLFQNLKDRISFIKEKLTEIRQIQEDFKTYWEKFPREKFRKLLRSTEDTEEAYSSYLNLLEQYANAGIKDEQTENNLWCLESAFKAGLIIAGKRKVDLELFERIFDSLGGKEMSKFDLVKEAKHRLQVCHGLQKWGKRIKGGVTVNFEEMKRCYEEYKEVCSNIQIGDSLENVEKALGNMEKTLRKTDKSLFLGELKEIRDKMRMSPIVSDKELANIEKRIFLCEKLSRKVSQMTEEELAHNFESLLQEYQGCRVKINKFEEVLAKHEKEEHFIKNIEKIMSEESDQPFEKIHKLREDFSQFSFCKFCEVELLLVNREVEMLKTEWDRALALGKTQQEARHLLTTQHSVNLSYFEGLENQLTTLRDKIRHEIQQQLSGKSKRPILADIMKQECDKLQDLLLFLRTVFTKKDGLKSGKTSVFEKSLECFLENYKSKPNKHRSLSGVIKRSNMSDEELRKVLVGELKRHFENMDILGLSESDAPYAARSLEQGIFVKLLDKNKYEKVMHKVISIFVAIKKHNLKELARYLRKQDFKPVLIVKLSQKPVEFLTKLENKLCIQRDNKRRSSFAKKYLAPFEDSSLIEKKIKKLKPMEEFDGYSLDDKDQSSDEDDPTDLGKNTLKPTTRQDRDEKPFIPLDNIDDKESIYADDEEEEKQTRLKELKKIVADNKPVGSTAEHPVKKLVKEKEPRSSDKKPRESTVTKSTFKYFKVYSGYFKLDFMHEKKRTSVEMFSCASGDFIRYFSKIPDNITLSSKLAKRDFDNYIDKALITEQKNYLVLPGFLESPQALALRTEMENRSLVMSMSYSRKCKMFVFPKEFIQSQWLEVLNVIMVREPTKRVELLYFLVLKLSNDDDPAHIEPTQIGLVDNLQPYLLKKNINEFVERPLEVNDKKDEAKSKVKTDKRGHKPHESVAPLRPKKMNIEDVRLGIDVGYSRSRNKLGDLLKGTVINSGKKDSGADNISTSKFESNHKVNRMAAEDIGLSTPTAHRQIDNFQSAGPMDGQRYDEVPPHISGGFQQIFENNLNSDQKMFVDKYDDFGINMTEQGMMQEPMPYENEHELRFSDDGNNSIPGEQNYGFQPQGFFDMNVDPLNPHGHGDNGDYVDQYNHEMNMMDQRGYGGREPSHHGRQNHHPGMSQQQSQYRVVNYNIAHSGREHSEPHYGEPRGFSGPRRQTTGPHGGTYNLDHIPVDQ